MRNLSLLEKLCTAVGVSGEEDAVRNIVLEELKTLADRVEITPLGNVIAYKKGKNSAAKKLLLTAQMDEVGLVVSNITENGLLRFEAVGDVSAEVLSGREILVGKSVPGVICAKPIHLLRGEEREKTVPIRELAIDIGAASKEEAERVVEIGDNVSFTPSFLVQHGTVQAKSLDARVGCWILLELLREEVEYDLTCAFTVQTEIGHRGAGTAAYLAEPDAVIALEGSPAADVSGVQSPESLCALGKGPVVSFADRWVLHERAYFRRALAIGKAQDIPCQPKTASVPGGDAGAVQVSRGGVRSVALGVPCRYTHGPVVLAKESDIENTLRLTSLLASEIAGGAL